MGYNLELCSTIGECGFRYHRRELPVHRCFLIAVLAGLAGIAIARLANRSDFACAEFCVSGDRVGQAGGYAKCMADAVRYLPRLLPPGSKVTLRCWNERPGGARLHNRYLLTDIGGVQFGDEIEVGDPGHEDRTSILDEPSLAKLWEHYTGTPPAFDAAGESAPRLSHRIPT